MSHNDILPKVVRPTALEGLKSESLDGMDLSWAEENKFIGGSKLSSPINSFSYNIYCFRSSDIWQP